MNKVIRGLVEWLKPIADNDTEVVKRYDPIRALWASVVLSGLVSHGRTKENVDWEYVNSELFEDDLENLGCQIPVFEIRKGLKSKEQ